MKILYFDGSNGISGDMLLKAVSRLSRNEEKIYEVMRHEVMGSQEEQNHIHDGHHHGRSYKKVRELIENSGFSFASKKTALKIYEYIAQAEAKVHGETLETVHFHEVGRNEAVKNALAVGMAIEYICPDKIMVSPIYDGKGKIICSHGEIDVPVPAVMALRENCGYCFKTADVNTEMVTPSGLAGLMGIGAEAAEDEDIVKKATVMDKIVVKGSRDTGRPGLTAYILKI